MAWTLQPGERGRNPCRECMTDFRTPGGLRNHPCPARMCRRPIISEAKRLEYAAFALRKHVEDATGYTYSMDGDDHADDERVQAFRAVWRASKQAQRKLEGGGVE